MTAWWRPTPQGAASAAVWPGRPLLAGETAGGGVVWHEGPCPARDVVDRPPRRGAGPRSPVRPTPAAPEPPEVRSPPDPAAPVPAEDTTDRQAAMALVTDLGRALHGAGLPSHRLEAEVGAVAEGLGLDVQVLAMPTALWVALGPSGHSTVSLVRVTPGDPDLARLVDLDDLATAVAQGRVGVAEARTRLMAIEARGPVWSGPAQFAAWGLSSAGAAVLFGGALLDVVLAATLGAAVRLLISVLAERPVAARGLLVLAALGASLAAKAVASTGAPVDPAIATVAALVVLLPGYSFTVGMVELGTGHLVSGTTRAASAGIGLLMLVLGVALAGGGPAAATLPGATPIPLPPFALPVALVAAPLAFGVLLGARARDLPWIVLASLVAVGGAQVGAALLGTPADAFVGAMALGLFGSAVTRWLHRPAALALVPGVLLLVPGSVGFRSLTALLSGDVLGGVDEAFHMALTAIALASGLALAPSVLPPRREAWTALPLPGSSGPGGRRGPAGTGPGGRAGPGVSPPPGR